MKCFRSMQHVFLIADRNICTVSLLSETSCSGLALSFASKKCGNHQAKRNTARNQLLQHQREFPSKTNKFLENITLLKNVSFYQHIVAMREHDRNLQCKEQIPQGQVIELLPGRHSLHQPLSSALCSPQVRSAQILSEHQSQALLQP